MLVAPWDDIDSWLNFMYQVLGADPRELQKLPLLGDRLAAITSYYASYGLPRQLSSLDELQLITDITKLYDASWGLEGVVDGQTLVNFRQTLYEMWIDLGLPPERL